MSDPTQPSTPPDFPAHQPPPASRSERLRQALGWSQAQLAAWLGVKQPTVWRLENGQPETGAMPRALDFLEQQISDGLHGEEAQRRLAGAHISPDIKPESDREIVGDV